MDIKGSIEVETPMARRSRTRADSSAVDPWSGVCRGDKPEAISGTTKGVLVGSRQALGPLAELDGVPAVAPSPVSSAGHRYRR